MDRSFPRYMRMAIAGSVGFISIGLVGFGLLSTKSALASPAAQATPPAESACIAVSTKKASPSTVELGSVADVTITVHIQCPGGDRPTIIKNLEIIDILPPNMEFVTDSDEPPATEVSAERDRLTWRTSFVPKSGVTFTLRVRPLELGTHRTNNGAFGEFRDNHGNVGRFELADPEVIVVEAVPPTPSPTNNPFPVPTVIDVPSFYQIFMPHALRHGEMTP